MMKMLLLDAQTSGGLLMSCDKNIANNVVENLKKTGYPEAAIIGKVIIKHEKRIYVQ